MESLLSTKTFWIELALSVFLFSCLLPYHIKFFFQYSRAFYNPNSCVLWSQKHSKGLRTTEVYHSNNPTSVTNFLHWLYGDIFENCTFSLCSWCIGLLYSWLEGVNLENFGFLITGIPRVRFMDHMHFKAYVIDSWEGRQKEQEFWAPKWQERSQEQSAIELFVCAFPRIYGENLGEVLGGGWAVVRVSQPNFEVSGASSQFSHINTRASRQRFNKESTRKQNNPRIPGLQQGHAQNWGFQPHQIKFLSPVIIRYLLLD